MFRKLVKNFLAAIIFFSMLGLVPAQAAGSIAGTKCATTNSVKIVNNRLQATKYVCLARGAKKTWSNGTALPPLSLDNLDTLRVREVAFQEVSNELQKMPAYDAHPIILQGPATSNSAVSSENPALLRSMKFWGDIYTPSKLFIAYISAGDSDWIDKAVCEKANNCASTDPRTHSWGDSMKANPSNCTFGEATATNDGVPLLVQCVGPGNQDVQNKQTGSHEYTHLVQQKYTTVFGNNPKWYIEGSAIYFGGVLGLYSTNTIPKDLNYVLRYDAKSWTNQTLCKVSSITVSEVIDCFKFSYLKGAQVPRDLAWQISSTSYYPGSLATEALVAVFGMSKIKEFVKNLKADNFDEAFELTFGISAETAYPKLAKYVVAMYKKGL